MGASLTDLLHELRDLLADMHDDDGSCFLDGGDTGCMACMCQDLVAEALKLIR